MLQKKFKVFRAIRFEDDHPELFSGFLFYCRQVSADYDVETGDALDARILKFMQYRFIEAECKYSERILMQEQLNLLIDRTKYDLYIDVAFYFLPVPPDESTTGSVEGIFQNLRTSLRYGKLKDFSEVIPREILITIPTEEVPLLSTLLPV